MKDWLGNNLNVGDTVLYTSKSTNVGMNIGELITLEPAKIQIRVWYIKDGIPVSAERGRVVTLFKGDLAFKSVTFYARPLTESAITASLIH